MAQKNLSVKLSLNDKQFQSSLKRATRSMKKFGSSMKRTGQTLSRNLTLPLLAFGAASIAAFDKQQKAIAQVEAGIKSTGMAAGFTSKQLQKMASELQGKTLFGDEVILKDATAQLLTFTNIAGEQFERTQLAALNLATRLDGDLKSASIQLGKALNDPIANLSALSRSGIQFSEEQKKVIKELAETNRLAEAQTLILDELDKQYGGAAEAAAQAGAGGLKQLQNQFGDLMEEIGGMLLPIVIDLGNQFKSFLEGFAKLDPEVKKMIVTAGILAGALGPLLVILGSIVTIVAALSIKFIAIAAAITGLALGILFVNDNWEAFKERFQDIRWWKNTLLEMTATLLDTQNSPFSLLLDAFNKIFDKEIENPFKGKTADFFRDMKTEVDDYETEFDDLTTFLENQGKKIQKTFKDLGKSLNVGGPSKVTTSTSSIPAAIPKRQIKQPGMMAGAMTQAVLPKDLENEALSLMDVFMQLDESIERIGDSLSRVLMAGAENFKDFADQVKSSVRSAIGALLAEGVAAAVSSALKNPLIALNPALIPVIAGAAGGLAKTAFNSLIPAFAEGGLVSGATLGLVGEGPGTSMSNPEVIAPLDKLRSMIGVNGGGAVQVFGTISGQDILLSSDRARNNRTRTRGY
tara:strand:- start:5225 stop:7129 length:1905 start_codon:yes stop_codon:yes gene_type:complete